MDVIYNVYDVIVIGGGPAGMAAALAAAELRLDSEREMQNAEFMAGGTSQGVVPGSLRLGSECEILNAEFMAGDAARDVVPGSSRVAIIERASRLGGILNQCTHSGFGLTYFGEELTGQEYARRFVERVESSVIDILTDTMVIDIGADRTLTISGAGTGFRRIKAKTVVMATGCRERPIGALPVAGSRPSGVFSAGAAQKMINLGGYDIGGRFVILGSGDVGLIVARELAIRGKEVIAVIEKEAECGGLERNRINCLERYGIPLWTLATVSEVHGMPRVSGVTVTGQSGGSRFIGCDTLITSVGLIPERDLLDGLYTRGKHIAVALDRATASGKLKEENGKLGTAAAIYDSGEFGAGGELGAGSVGGLPEWLFLCGNAAFVHDVVDDVTIESERVGRSAALAALRLRGKLKEDSRKYIADAIDRASASGKLKEESGKLGAGAALRTLCVACPKGCVAVKTEDGWSGLACGRSEPELQEL